MSRQLRRQDRMMLFVFVTVVILDFICCCCCCCWTCNLGWIDILRISLDWNKVKHDCHCHCCWILMFSFSGRTADTGKMYTPYECGGRITDDTDTPTPQRKSQVVVASLRQMIAVPDPSHPRAMGPTERKLRCTLSCDKAIQIMANPKSNSYMYPKLFVQDIFWLPWANLEGDRNSPYMIVKWYLLACLLILIGGTASLTCVSGLYWRWMRYLTQRNCRWI